jgi:hypothetical protein
VQSPSLKRCFRALKPSPRAQITFVAVSHLYACHHSTKLTTLIAVLFPSDKLLDDPQAAVTELQDYDTVEEAISLTDYGYASDSDLDEEEEEPSTTLLEDSR